MPLSDHEQRILEEIEKRLHEEDPRLAEAVSKTSPYKHAIRRIRWGVVAFVLGFVMLLLFQVSVWVAIGGFSVMLFSTLLVYHQLRRLGRDQVREVGGEGRPSPTSLLARLAERFRMRRGDG